MLKNAKSLPEVYYGLHFAAGVARYQEPDKEPYCILINENIAKQMDSTFDGKPVFVEHVDQVNLENLEAEADGYVFNSFYNPIDGMHWVKFIVTSDEGKKAIANGWRLSNAYVPETIPNRGQWHGVDYVKEVTGGEYEHLAIVKNPRYEESIILTPEQFKQYNEEKDAQLKRLANSKDQQGEKTMGLNFFKRSKVENAIDLESTMVELPKSKKEVKISDLVAQADKIENMQGYASGDHMVKVGNDEMSVNDLVKKHMDICNEMEEMKKPKEDSEKNSEESEEEDEKEVGDRGGDKALDNEEDDKKAKEKKKPKRMLLKKQKL